MNQPLESSLDDCPLSPAAQNRNIFCFVMYWCVFYLCAPVTYVGTTHANLLQALGNNDEIANIPSAIYQWVTFIPVCVAWFFSHPKYLKPLMLLALSLISLATGMVASLLWIDASPIIKSASVIAHGAAMGIGSGVLIASLWDSLRRGVSTSRRGRALGFTFGCGPIFACIGSLAQDALFDGKLTGQYLGLGYPWNFILLFAAVAPLLLLAGITMLMFQIPPATEADEQKGNPLVEIASGLHQFIRNRVLWYTILIYVVVYSGGNAILSNVSLHADEILGGNKETLGIQNFLRFGCKAIAGGLLGVLLAKTSARATLLATTLTLVAGMTWALNTTGWPFMATFGLLGAGELFGAYFPNYVVTASPKHFVRINMAYLSLLSTFIGFSAVLFGWISEHYSRNASFIVAEGMLILALVMIAFLPANPTPKE